MGSTDRDLGSHIQSLLKSARFSDLQISCEGRDFAVHKAILCTQSPVMSAACEGGFKVCSKESITTGIKIEEFDTETVERMLEFLYSGDYSVPEHASLGSHEVVRISERGSEGEQETTSVTPNESDRKEASISKTSVLCHHLRVNAIGDYYDIQPLCVLALLKLRIALEKHWSPDEFLHLLTEAYTTRKTGDARFHQLMGEIIAKHPEDLAELQGLDTLDMPGVIVRGIIAVFMERSESLRREILLHGRAVRCLESLLLMERYR